MDFAHICFAVCVNHEGVYYLASFKCADHRESAICGGEGDINQLECVINCHRGEAGGRVVGGVHVAHDGVGEFRECVREGADRHVRGGVPPPSDGLGWEVELGEVFFSRRTAVSV